MNLPSISTVCAICMEALDQESECHTLECGHTFHTVCALKWFRCSQSDGACPLCKDKRIYLPCVERVEGLKMLQQLCRRKACPSQLKKMNDNRKRLQSDYKAIAKELVQFKKHNKDFFKKWTDLRRGAWQLGRKVRRCESAMIMFGKMQPIFIKK